MPQDMGKKSLSKKHSIMLQQMIQRPKMIIKIKMFKKMLIFGNGETSWCSQNKRQRHEDSKPQIVIELSVTSALDLYKVFERTDTDRQAPSDRRCQVKPKKHYPSRTFGKLPPSLGYSYGLSDTLSSQPKEAHEIL
jgi:hypothetical protein